MAWQTADRVKETTTTTGTGALTLAGAMTGFRAFSSVCSNGDTCYYGLAAVDGNGNPTGVWETGIGTYSAASTLTRTTVLASSNSGSAVTLPTGTAQVWLDMPATALAALVSSGFGTDQNGFVDGNFDFWSVNTTFSLVAATDTYTADMWVCNAGTGGAATVSRNVATLGSEPAAMARPRQYRLSYQQTTSASASPTIGQKLESVGQYNGQTITVSGTFACGSAAALVTGIRYTQNFGTGGAPSSTVTATTTLAWAIGTSEALYSAELAIPAISGKTLGSAGNDYLRIDLLLATGATYTLFASQLQIDVCHPSASANTTGSGGVPRPYRYRGLQTEKGRLQNYLRMVGAYQAVGGSYSTTAGTVSSPLSPPMRTTPVVTINGNSIQAPGFGTGAATLTVNAVNANSISLAFTGYAVTVAIGVFVLFAGTIELDARL